MKDKEIKVEVSNSKTFQVKVFKPILDNHPKECCVWIEGERYFIKLEALPSFLEQYI